MDQEICLLLKTDTSSPLGPKRRVSCGRRHRRTRRLMGVDVSFPPLLSLSAGPAADTAQHFGWAGVGGWAGLQKKKNFSRLVSYRLRVANLSNSVDWTLKNFRPAPPPSPP